MVLLVTAISVGFVHTLLGPDHYLPFIVIGRARRWGLGRTSLLTFACGMGHVLSSVVLGLVGAALGAAIADVEQWEGMRGEWAGWGLMVFGLGYTAWGVWRAIRGKPHSHLHAHAGGVEHDHDHDHDHTHTHEKEGEEIRHEHGHPLSWQSLTPWLLFLIFVLGPCEPLVPLFFASALEGNWTEVLLVGGGYLVSTLVGMHLLVTLFWLGLSKVPLGPLERWSNVIAGALILAAGFSMVFLGL